MTSCVVCAEPYCADCVEADAAGSVCRSCKSASESSGVASASNESDWTHVPHPWRRYWARSFDYLLGGVLLGMLIGILFELAGLNLELVPDILFGMLLVTLWAPFEGVLLGLWGTTPGKALLATRVRTKTGDTPPFGTGMRRSFSVWVRGMGLGLGFVQLIANIVAYRKLTSEKETTWDGHYGLVVEHRPLGFLRVASFLAIFSLLFVFLFWSATLEP